MEVRVQCPRTHSYYHAGSHDITVRSATAETTNAADSSVYVADQTLQLSPDHVRRHRGHTVQRAVADFRIRRTLTTQSDFSVSINWAMGARSKPAGPSLRRDGGSYIYGTHTYVHANSSLTVTVTVNGLGGGTVTTEVDRRHRNRDDHATPENVSANREPRRSPSSSPTSATPTRRRVAGTSARRSIGRRR